ncbi:hypothetical protein BH10BDE1_BH10BDE1_16840 [soil metagenome]
MRLRGFKNRLSRGYVLVLAAVGAFACYQPASAFTVRCDRLFEDAGPVVRLQLPGILRDPTASRLKRLKVAHYSLNTFNLFPGPKSRPYYQNHEAVFDTIENERPDILTLTEVMNRETLQELASRLRGQYQPVWIDGNGDVSVVVLIRKSLPLVVEVESNRSIRHDYLGQSEPIFTRDLLMIHLSLPGGSTPLLSIAAGHFKAQKDNFSLDPLFRIKRSAEEHGALEILDRASRLRGSRARILIGDMNSDVRLTTEMQDFKAAGYREALDVLGIPLERRRSHSYFPRDGAPSFWQTDAAFVSPEISHRNALVSGYIAVDRTRRGQSLARPRTIDEMRTRGSDHQMIILELDVTKLTASTAN